MEYNIRETAAADFDMIMEVENKPSAMIKKPD